MKLSRTALHLKNVFLEDVQKKIKFENYQGNAFEINIKELNAIAELDTKDHKQLKEATRKMMQPVEIRKNDNPEGIEFLVPIYYA